MTSPEQWVRLAQIVRPQGRKGEVLADLYTEHTEQFGSERPVFLAPAGFTEGGSAAIPTPIGILAHWLPVGRNAGRIVLQLAGVDSIENAEALAGKEVVIPASERVPLTDGSVYVADLVGASVFDREARVGVVEDVLFPTTPDGTRRLDDAVPLLSVASPQGDELLIPFASAYLVDVDLVNRRVRMQLPEGLLDINRGRPAPGDDHLPESEPEA